MRIKSAKASKLGGERVPRTPNILKPRREVGIDIWRGFAVMLMIITHAIAFFHIGDDPIITNLGIFGGIASFTMFLFLSGASSYFGFVKYKSDEHGPEIARRRNKIAIRTGFILLGYYIVAIVSSVPQLSFPPSADTWEVLIKILTLQVFPPFAEFILAFVLFNLLLLLLRPVYHFFTQFPILLVILGILLYAAGTYLAQVDLGDPLNSYKALLAGHENIHTFPILQFSIVYFFGMGWGKFLFRHSDKDIRTKISTYVLVLNGLLIFAGTVTFGQLGFEFLDPTLRFPPSILLIAIGLFTGYVFWLILQLTNYGKIFGPLQVLLHYMGTKAFDFFVVHTIILFLYKYITHDQHHESSIVVVALFLLLLLLTFVVTAFLESIITNLKESDKSDSEYGWLVSEKLIVNTIWILLAVVVGLTAFQSQVSATSLEPEDVSFKKRLLREEEWPFWWDHAYYAFRQITITNEGTFPITSGNWYQLSFDHKAAVAKGSKTNGNDVRIIFYNTNEDLFIELPFSLQGANTANATVKFATQQSIGGGQSDDRYFLYYGNPNNNKATTANDAPDSAQTAGLALSDEFKHRLNGTVGKKWHLKEGISALQLRTMKYTVQLDADLSPDSIVTFNVVGTDVRGSMDKLGNGKFEAQVPVGDLEAGNYTIRAIAREPEDKLKLITSGNSKFFVTYPLYVTWTQDWEGSVIPDFNWLPALDQMAQKYSMPMTHFFNPRIYVTSDIDANLADRYTLWVQDRAKNYNDEIGLHLHMWTDMVIAAGVTPKYSPVAPWLGGGGYGTLTSAYTKEEMKKILNWSKLTFQDNGLLAPTSYRAGGWFTEEHTLQALAETGFLMDSSGRTLPSNPRQVAYPPSWNLTATTKPYQPNVNDQNSEKAPHINIWEFPNNGADSYWYNAQDLIDRFNANYPNKGQVLLEPQVLTYLSHPPFFRVFHNGGTDETKMSAVFDQTGKYLYEDDAGPIVYSTLENAYYGYTPWAREQEVINQ